MIKIDHSLLEEIGLGSLPNSEKDSLLKHIYETLEMRVGMRLADQMTNQQLDEFEQYFEAKDDAGAFKWLETNFPNYKDVVQQEFDKLKAEVQAAAPQILAAAQTPQHQPGAFGPKMAAVPAPGVTSPPQPALTPGPGTAAQPPLPPSGWQAPVPGQPVAMPPQPMMPPATDPPTAGVSGVQPPVMPPNQPLQQPFGSPSPQAPPPQPYDDPGQQPPAGPGTSSY